MGASMGHAYRFAMTVLVTAVTFAAGLWIGWRGSVLLFGSRLAATTDRWAVAATFAGTLSAVVTTLIQFRRNRLCSGRRTAGRSRASTVQRIKNLHQANVGKGIQIGNASGTVNINRGSGDGRVPR
jgi:hypothetical protein